MADEPMGNVGFDLTAGLVGSPIEQNLTNGAAEVQPDADYLKSTIIEQQLTQDLVPLLGTFVGETTIPVYANRVWDTVEVGFVRWDTENIPDPSGVFYPGPGVYGVNTSDYCVEYLGEDTEPAGAGSIGTVPNSSDITASDADILAAPLRGVSTDLTGNHVFNAGTFVNSGYNLESVSDLDSGSFLEASSGTAHRLATASGVTFGGMFRPIEPPQNVASYIISSAETLGSGNHNYSLLWNNGVLNLQMGPAGQLTSLVYVHEGSSILASTPRDTNWAHIVCQIDPNRAVARVFINGAQYGPDVAVATPGAPSGSDFLIVGGVNGTAAGDFGGYARNVFISSVSLSATYIRRLAEESFGHALPV